MLTLNLCCRRLRRARCCVSSVLQIFWENAKTHDPVSERPTLTSFSLNALPLSLFLHFHTSPILFVVIWIFPSDTHTLLFCDFLCSLPLSPPSPSLFITTSVQLADIEPATTENDVINYLGRDYVIKLPSLCFCGAMCARSHLTVCTWAHSIVYALVLCIDAHIIIFRQEWKTSRWAICWLNCWPTVVFTDKGQT